MGVVCLRFKFRPTQETKEVLRKVKVMEQRAVNWLVANKKTALNSVHHALYFPLRQQFPELHSHWVTSALKTATNIVHAFNKRKRKGQTKRPKLKKPFVTLSPHLFKVSFEGKWLKVTIFKSANDLEPIVRWFKPHHKYRRLLDRWKAGECTLGQITLTESSLCIPLKFADVPVYQPKWEGEAPAEPKRWAGRQIGNSAGWAKNWGSPEVRPPIGLTFRTLALNRSDACSDGGSKS
ncbi:MAG: hypothetical protein SLRJCFUN_000074, partial [Candidatus Fervidibacter sp.]